MIFFQVKNSLFLSAGNLVNLMAQSAFIITLGMAEIFVLLLGDIDLAAGFTAACAAVIALWMLALGDPWWAAVLVALVAAAAYGALQGDHHRQARAAVVRGDAGRPARPVRPAALPDQPPPAASASAA